MKHPTVQKQLNDMVAPLRERELKHFGLSDKDDRQVAPSRERELKHLVDTHFVFGDPVAPSQELKLKLDIADNRQKN